MATIHRNEEYRSLERSEERQSEDASSDSRLTHEHIKTVFIRRREMLSSIEAVIGADFYEAIAAKVEYENNYLLTSFESDEEAREVKKRDIKILNSQYFIHKKLDPRQFLTL